MIVDTSAILAFFDRDEPDHEALAAVLSQSSEPLVVSPRRARSSNCGDGLDVRSCPRNRQRAPLSPSTRVGGRELDRFVRRKASSEGGFLGNGQISSSVGSALWYRRACFPSRARSHSRVWNVAFANRLTCGAYAEASSLPPSGVISWTSVPSRIAQHSPASKEFLGHGLPRS